MDQKFCEMTLSRMGAMNVLLGSEGHGAPRICESKENTHEESHNKGSFEGPSPFLPCRQSVSYFPGNCFLTVPSSITWA